MAERLHGCILRTFHTLLFLAANKEEGDSSPRVISSNIEFRCRRTKLSSASALQCESRQRRHCSMCKRSRAHDEGEFALSPVNGRTECSNPRHQVSHAQQEHESSVLPPWAAAEAYFSGRLRGEIQLFCSDERQRALMHVQTGPLASSRRLRSGPESLTFMQMV